MDLILNILERERDNKGEVIHLYKKGDLFYAYLTSAFFLNILYGDETIVKYEIFNETVALATTIVPVSEKIENLNSITSEYYTINISNPIIYSEEDILNWYLMIKQSNTI